MGELALEVFLLAIQALKEGFKGFILPKENALEAAIVKGLNVYGVFHLDEVIDFFEEKKPLEPIVVDTRSAFKKQMKFPEFDFSDVRGQETIKRCMEIAAAGGHNLILIGPNITTYEFTRGFRNYQNSFCSGKS